MMRTAIFVFGTAMAGLVGASNIGMDLDREFGLFLRAAASTQNLQTFTGSLGGATADPITATGNTDRPFAIPSGETFTKLSDAVQQSCANQFNTCQKAANAPGGGGGGDSKNAAAGAGAVTVSACTDQQNQCKAAVNNSVSVGSSGAAASSTTAQSTTTTATTSSLGILRSQDANFFYFCDS